MNHVAKGIEDNEGGTFLGLGKSMGRELVEIEIVEGEYHWLMYMFQDRLPLYL
jgi:hypothetical protein